MQLYRRIFGGHRVCLCLLIALCLGVGVNTRVLAQNLLLTLASQPLKTGIASTRSSESLSLAVASGHSASFSRASGRDYRLEASGGFFWTQVQELPRDAESITLTPTVRDDGSVEVAVNRSSKNGTRTQSSGTTLVTDTGEWLQLFGPAKQSGTTVYGTQATSGDSLYLLVERY